MIWQVCWFEKGGGDEGGRESERERKQEWERVKYRWKELQNLSSSVQWWAASKMNPPHVSCPLVFASLYNQLLPHRMWTEPNDSFLILRRGYGGLSLYWPVSHFCPFWSLLLGTHAAVLGRALCRALQTMWVSCQEDHPAEILGQAPRWATTLLTHRYCGLTNTADGNLSQSNSNQYPARFWY